MAINKKTREDVHIKYTNLKYKVREGVFNGQF